MKLSRKSVVQKTVRIDTKLEDDLELLSKILDRSQNDILNTALASLFQENSSWFKYAILVDGFWDLLENGAESQECSFGGVTVKAYWAKDADVVNLEYTLKDQGKIIDSYKYSLADSGELKEKLIELAEYVDTDSPEVKKYLQERTKYD